MELFILARDIALLQLYVPVMELDSTQNDQGEEPESMTAGEVVCSPEGLTLKGFLLCKGVLHNGAHYFSVAEVD